MLKIILNDSQHIHPFNERARDLRVGNQPLWLAQRDVLLPYTDREVEIPWGVSLPEISASSTVPLISSSSAVWRWIDRWLQRTPKRCGPVVRSAR